MVESDSDLASQSHVSGGEPLRLSLTVTCEWWRATQTQRLSLTVTCEGWRAAQTQPHSHVHTPPVTGCCLESRLGPTSPSDKLIPPSYNQLKISKLTTTFVLLYIYWEFAQLSN